MENDLDSVLNEQPEPTQVDPPVVDQPAETGEEVQAPPATEDPIEKRIKGLEAAAAAERRKRQQIEEQYQRLAQQQQPQRTEEGPPDPERFQDNPQEYWRLLARYEARQELQQVVRQSQEQQAANQRQAAAMATKDRLDSLILRGQAKYGDFDAVINAGLGPFLSPTLAEAIAESEVGDDVSYWLGKNPAEAHRIAQLPERQMVRELTKLESKVTAPVRPSIPQTLTAVRDSRGQFAPQRYDGPTPLDQILARK